MHRRTTESVAEVGLHRTRRGCCGCPADCLGHELDFCAKGLGSAIAQAAAKPLFGHIAGQQLRRDGKVRGGAHLAGALRFKNGRNGSGHVKARRLPHLRSAVFVPFDARDLPDRARSAPAPGGDQTGFRVRSR